jgi:hypothetical protein
MESGYQRGCGGGPDICIDDCEESLVGNPGVAAKGAKQ